MKLKVKSTSLIAAIVMLFVAGILLVNESNAEETIYKIGSKGPAGGWIFYDKGSNSDGWRYLEAAPADQKPAKWGTRGILIQGAKDTAVETGKSNTAEIIINCKTEEIAAKVTADYQGGGKSDWFLPSKDELYLMYVNLFKAGVGDFAEGSYWSSSEDNAHEAWSQNFNFGTQYNHLKYYIFRVRAIRAF